MITMGRYLNPQGRKTRRERFVFFVKKTKHVIVLLQGWVKKKGKENVKKKKKVMSQYPGES